MKCQYCNTEIPDNSSFCPHCGQKAAPAENGPEKKFCDNCSAPLEPGQSFCPGCGKPVNGDPQPDPSFGQDSQAYSAPYNASATAGQQPRPKKKTGLIVAIVIICLVVLAGICTAAGFLIFNTLNTKEDKQISDVTVSQDETDKNDPDGNVTDGDDSAGDTTDEGDTDSDDSGSAGLVNGKFKSLEDFVNSDIMKQQMESQFSSMEGTGLSLELTADGNKLIYNLTIEDPDLSSVMDKSALESYLDSQASTFEAIARALPASVNVENPVVVVRYLDSNGDVIASREFPAK